MVTIQLQFKDYREITLPCEERKIIGFMESKAYSVECNELGIDDAYFEGYTVEMLNLLAEEIEDLSEEQQVDLRYCLSVLNYSNINTAIDSISNLTVYRDITIKALAIEHLKDAEDFNDRYFIYMDLDRYTKDFGIDYNEFEGNVYVNN